MVLLIGNNTYNKEKYQYSNAKYTSHAFWIQLYVPNVPKYEQWGCVSVGICYNMCHHTKLAFRYILKNAGGAVVLGRAGHGARWEGSPTMCRVENRQGKWFRLTAHEFTCVRGGARIKVKAAPFAIYRFICVMVLFILVKHNVKQMICFCCLV